MEPIAPPQAAYSWETTSMDESIDGLRVASKESIRSFCDSANLGDVAAFLIEFVGHRFSLFLASEVFDRQYDATWI